LTIGSFDGGTGVFDGQIDEVYLYGRALASAEVLVLAGVQPTADASETGNAASIAATPLLHPSYPNPFNPRTTISYELPDEQEVTLTVYDVAGRRVRSLLDGSFQAAGLHAVQWDGRDDTGERVSSGIYYSRLKAGDRSAIRSMVLMK
jgi:hypothetical protein